MHSLPIANLTLSNTRDLGGLPTHDGRRVKHGRLIRSGGLAEATHEDVRVLAGLVRHVVDLRNDYEHEHHPDPEIAGASNYFAPAISSAAMGVTRGQKTPLEQVVGSDFDAEAYMRGIYVSIVSGEQGQKSYRLLFELLLSCEEGAVLWHCTVGKDRTGLAAFLIEHALGVLPEAIEEDYLATNAYNEAVNARDRRRTLANIPPELHTAATARLDALFCANAGYLRAAQDVMAELHGSVDGYLEAALGLTPQRRERLRAMYLE